MPPKKSKNQSKSLIKQSHTLATTVNRARSMEARPKMYAKHNKRVEYEQIDNDTVSLSGKILVKRQKYLGHYFRCATNRKNEHIPGKNSENCKATVFIY